MKYISVQTVILSDIFVLGLTLRKNHIKSFENSMCTHIAVFQRHDSF